VANDEDVNTSKAANAIKDEDTSSVNGKNMATEFVWKHSKGSTDESNRPKKASKNITYRNQRNQREKEGLVLHFSRYNACTTRTKMVSWKGQYHL
jgi:hypothetical protein